MLFTRPRGQELDGYLFSDYDHAIEWVNQKYLLNKKCSVWKVSFRRRRCCGEVYAVKKLERVFNR